MSDLSFVLYIALEITILAIIFIVAVIAIIAILFQKSNSDGIQGITASSETFYGKNRGRSIESKLKKWTWIALIIIGVLAIAAYIVDIVVSIG